MLDKIEARSLQARVYQRLKQALIAGYFEPGQVLVIRELAEQLGTSPMPIRQSISRLVSEHALQEDDKPRSSVQVPQLSDTIFEELRAMRVLVESEAAAIAATKIEAIDLNKLRRLDSQIQHAIAEKDVTSTIVTNCDFHFALYRIAQSTTLLRTIESLWLQSGPYFRVLVKRYFADEAGEGREVNAHKALLDALAAHDAEAARKALADDINKAGDYFVSMPEQARNSNIAHLEERRALLGKKAASAKNRPRRLP